MTRRQNLALLSILALCAIGTRDARAGVAVAPSQDLALLRTSDPFSVSIAVLEDGSFAIGANEVRPFQPGNPRFRFVVQFYGPEGMPLGEPVSPGGNSHVPRGGVGSVGDRYFVTWENFRGVTTSGFYDSQGERLGRPFSWPRSEASYFPRWYRFAPAPSHRILPLVFRQVGTDRFDRPILKPVVQVFDRRANPLGPAFDLEPISANRTIEIEALAINGQGRFLVVSLQCPGSPWSRQPCLRGVQVFDRAGRVLKAFSTRGIQQLTSGPDRAISFHVGARRNGSYVLSWIEGFEAGDFRFLMRSYNRGGMPTASPTVIAETGSDPISTTILENTGDGGFLASWLVFSQGGPTATVYLRQIDASGTRLGEPVLVTADEFSVGPVLAINSTGHGVIAWPTRHEQVFGGRFSLITVTPDAAQSLQNAAQDEAPKAGGEPNER